MYDVPLSLSFIYNTRHCFTVLANNNRTYNLLNNRIATVLSTCSPRGRFSCYRQFQKYLLSKFLYFVCYLYFHMLLQFFETSFLQTVYFFNLLVSIPMFLFYIRVLVLPIITFSFISVFQLFFVWYRLFYATPLFSYYYISRYSLISWLIKNNKNDLDP